MRTYRVLVYGGQLRPPRIYPIVAEDDEAATTIADGLLAKSRDGVGVETLDDKGGRIYVRGVVPRRPI